MRKLINKWKARMKAKRQVRRAEKEIKENPDIDRQAKELIRELSKWGNHLKN